MKLNEEYFIDEIDIFYPENEFVWKCYGDGKGGEFIVIYPKDNLDFVYASFMYNSLKDGRGRFKMIYNA